MIPQLPLALGLKDSAAFESYFPGPNSEALEHLRRLITHPGESGLYLWGVSGVGKTHLLQAACRAAGELDLAAVYLPLRAADQFPCEALDGLENVAVVCIDDLDAIAGRPQWESALVRLFERSRRAGGSLVTAGMAKPAELGFGMAQLSSRLAGSLVLQLRSLDEEQMLQALQLRAARRGFKLPAEIGRYLLRRCCGDMHALFDALESLDRVSLAAKRKLTLPFVRTALKDSDSD